MAQIRRVLLFGLLVGFNGFAIQVNVGEAPETNRALTIRAIKSARHSLLLNIYEMTSDDIADVIIGRIRQGIYVEILEEGQPTAGMAAAGKKVMDRIVAAMNESGRGDHFFLMTSKAGGKRRFRFDHGKYIVIDGKSLLIGSENYSPSGQPVPGQLGNRGWEAWIHDVPTAEMYATLFHSDASTSHGDVMEMVTGKDLLTSFLTFSDALKLPQLLSNVVEGIAEVVDTMEALEVNSITSPDSSLSGLLEMMNSAQTSLDIEQMTFAVKWGQSSSQSPLVDAVIRSARRGVRVRVLLNDDTVFSSKGKNYLTVDKLNQIAEAENLDLEARTANVKAMNVSYIHNKGALVDSNKTLVSSINWNQNSVENNRETAVLLVSESIFDHFEALFEHDWNVSNSSH